MHPPNNPPSPQPSDHHIYQSTTVDPNHLTTLTTPFSLADFLNDENSTTTTTTPPPSFHDHTQEIQTPAHVMNPFAFYDSHDHSQDTSANMNSPAAYDLYINLMNDAVSEATREFATPFVSDPQTSETASLSPDSSLPSSPVMDQAIYYNNITHSTSETLSNGYSSPISTLPVVDQNMFLYDPAPLHNNSSSTRSNRKSPKSRSRSRARIGSKLSPETDANGSKIFTCEYPTCDKTFKRLEHMKRHVRSLHTLEKPFTCPDRSCGKRFARSDNLNQHIRTHQQTKEKQEQDEQQNEANHNSLNPSMQSYNANADGMVV